MRRSDVKARDSRCSPRAAAAMIRRSTSGCCSAHNSLSVNVVPSGSSGVCPHRQHRRSALSCCLAWQYQHYLTTVMVQLPARRCAQTTRATALLTAKAISAGSDGRDTAVTAKTTAVATRATASGWA
jgi:hypothetical protein